MKFRPWLACPGRIFIDIHLSMMIFSLLLWTRNESRRTEKEYLLSWNSFYYLEHDEREKKKEEYDRSIRNPPGNGRDVMGRGHGRSRGQSVPRRERLQIEPVLYVCI